MSAVPRHVEGPRSGISLVRWREPGAPPSQEARLGLVRADQLRDLAAGDLGQIDEPADLNAFLADPDWGRLDRLARSSSAEDWRPLSEVVLDAPVVPRQVLQTGANYRTHVIDLVTAGQPDDDPRGHEEIRAWAAEMMDERRETGEPYFFIGLPACVVGDAATLALPPWSRQVDWELELAVVIGPGGFRIPRDDAMDHVAGYTIVNDITARDFVFRKDMKAIGTDWYRGKNAPGFLPSGPFLVPAHDVDPADSRVRLELNGTTMQDASTSDLLFDVPALISAASQNMPLLPGDLLLTGSPAGNGAHWGRLLRSGDRMVGSISGLGSQIVDCLDESDREEHP